MEGAVGPRHADRGDGPRRHRRRARLLRRLPHARGSYPIDVVDAGVRAYDRWAYDTFGSKKDRLLLSGAIGSIQDVKGTIKELDSRTG
jgi:hypothetical protein